MPSPKFDPSFLDRFLRPRLRLFLSVDIVGSTALKQSPQNFGPESTGTGQPWFYPIATFYREVERLLLQVWSEHANDQNLGFDLGQPPQLWKGAGDELLYIKELSDHRQVYWSIAIWMKALNAHRGGLRSKWNSLDLKSAVWLAGFPLMNSEVILHSDHAVNPEDIIDDPHYWNCILLDHFYEHSDQRSGMVRDFIGPSIDTGFRLSQLATPRKLIVSIELAYLFASVGLLYDESSRIPMYYDGRAALKGVLGGLPYPVFWLDMLSGDKVLAAEDEIGGPHKPTEATVRHVSQFCQAFIDDNPQYLVRPYIVSDPNPMFSTPSPSHQERLREHARVWAQRKETRQIEKRALQGDSPPGESPPATPPDRIDRFEIPEPASSPDNNG